MYYFPDRFSELLGFCFQLCLILFIFMPCDKLGWPSRQLLSACKCTVLYRTLSM